MSNSAFTPTFAQNLQDASATQKGLVNTTTQVFAGDKTFTGKVISDTLQAATSGGLSFKENDGTTTGTVSDAGAWTLGPSDGSVTHTVKGTVWHGKSTNIWLDSNLTQTLAAGALNNILTTSAAGLLCAYDSNSGSTALFLIAGTSITKIADPKNNWNTTDATNINRLYISGSNYNLKNAGASSNTYRLFFMSFEGTL